MKDSSAPSLQNGANNHNGSQPSSSKDTPLDPDRFHVSTNAYKRMLQLSISDAGYKLATYVAGKGGYQRHWVKYTIDKLAKALGWRKQKTCDAVRELESLRMLIVERGTGKAKSRFKLTHAANWGDKMVNASVLPNRTATESWRSPKPDATPGKTYIRSSYQKRDTDIDHHHDPAEPPGKTDDDSLFACSETEKSSESFSLVTDKELGKNSKSAPSRTREAYTAAEFNEAVKRLGISPKVAWRCWLHRERVRNMEAYLCEAQAVQEHPPSVADRAAKRALEREERWDYERKLRKRAIEEMERINREAEAKVEAERRNNGAKKK